MTNLPPSFSPDPRRRRPTSNAPSTPAASQPQRAAEATPENSAHHDGAPPRRARSTHTTGASRQTPTARPQNGTPKATPPRRQRIISSAHARPVSSQNVHSTERQSPPTQPPAFAPSQLRQRRLSTPTPPQDSAVAAPPRHARPPHQSSSARITRERSRTPQGVFRSPSSQRQPHSLSTHRSWRGRRRVLVATAITMMIILVGWPVFLFHDANTHLSRVDALSGAPDTPGTTYLLAGSDSRADGPISDDTEGQRSDSIMLLHVAPNGQRSAISIPRDTWVDIPGYGEDKINAAYALEGPTLLVQTVEGLTGLTVDHYVEIGMGGVANIVDAVGGVELCLDYDVSDPLSELEWTAGCHVSDGRTALAFSRMRYADPTGDIGRAERQRQVVTKTVKSALSPSVLIPPRSALALERAGAQALRVDHDTSAWNILSMVRTFRAAGNDGMTGAPPIEDLAYSTYSGSAVLLQDVTAPDFFTKMREGTLTLEDLKQDL